MADLLYSEAAFSTAHDVCSVCGKVFPLAEGCLCKACGRRHWHDEICLPLIQASRTDHPMGNRLQTRPGIAWVLYQRMGGDGFVTGFSATSREHRIQIWVRTLGLNVRASYEDAVRAAIGDVAFDYEVIVPPMWDFAT